MPSQTTLDGHRDQARELMLTAQEAVLEVTKERTSNGMGDLSHDEAMELLATARLYTAAAQVHATLATMAVTR